MTESTVKNECIENINFYCTIPAGTVITLQNTCDAKQTSMICLSLKPPQLTESEAEDSLYPNPVDC